MSQYNDKIIHYIKMILVKISLAVYIQNQENQKLL